ncbi:MAG TPA: type II secretion system protein [Candidatus Cryosericum sp.]
MRSTLRGKKHGFTLIELMVVVAIMVILTVLMPMLASDTILNRQMYDTGTQLREDLLLAQNQAITHSSGGPTGGSLRYLMRLYLGDNNAFAYETTETYSALSSSLPSPGGGVVVRTMPSTFGFPAFFDNPASVASVTIGPTGSSAGVMTGYVDVVFDNQGLAYWSANKSADPASFMQTTGSIMITNSSASKRIQVTVSVIGRVSMAWVPGYK